MCEQCVNLEHRLEVAKQETISLQERVAFAEQARDNAIASSDEIQARAKGKVAVAGQIIAKLLTIIRRSGSKELQDAAALIITNKKDNDAPREIRDDVPC